MKVKICGLTNKDDAVWAVNYGADYLGVNLYKDSPRHNTVASASKWISEIPSWAQVVGVFVNAEIKDIVHAAQKLKLKGLQLHGDESPEFIQSLKAALEETGLNPFIIKAFRVKSEEDLSVLPSYADSIDYILLDARTNGERGGTGQTFNWDLAVKAKEVGKPLILAGGLKPENIKEAIKKVQPFAVDVASGVEKSPRKKDVDKVKQFIQNAKS